MYTARFWLNHGVLWRYTSPELRLHARACITLHEANNRKRFRAGRARVFGYFTTVHGEYIITAADNVPHRYRRHIAGVHRGPRHIHSVCARLLIRLIPTRDKLVHPEVRRQIVKPVPCRSRLKEAGHVLLAWA